jgi:hypothetical protein
LATSAKVEIMSLDLEEAQRNLGLSTDLHLKASWAVVYGPRLIAELSAARAVVEAFRIVAEEIPDMGDYWGGYIDETYPPEDWAILRAGVEALADYEKVGK